MSIKPKRIALWGGSFNPPTIAHKSLAEYAFKALSLDYMYWIVSPHNPEKDIATLASFQDRFAMVEGLLKDKAQMEASDIEQFLGSSLTTNTVTALRNQMPEDHLFFMMGADNWLGFYNWSGSPAEILEKVSIIVLNRPGYQQIEASESSRIFSIQQVFSTEDLRKSGTWYVLDNPSMDISATNARKELSEEKIPEMLAPETLDYIINHGLYKEKS